MKPELDDVELARLELRLRKSVVGRRPNAPASLYDFIGQVPDAGQAPIASVVTPGRLRFGRSAQRRMRRGTTGVAAAVAIAFVIAGGAVLVAVRHGQVQTSPSAPASASSDFEAGGWSWRRVGEPAPGLIASLANGYLGECVANGLPAVCTSKDGVKWTLPADPAVFVADGAAPFDGWSIAHGPGGWVAAGTIDPGTWRSSDGVHWSAVAVDLPGLQRAQVQALAGGFVMVAQVYGGQQTASRLLTSTDGATWTPLDLPAGVSEPQPGGAIGLAALETEQVNGSPVSHAVSSSEGLSWTALTLPDGVSGLSSSTRLQSGTYVGLGTAGWAYGAKTLLTSADGLTWHAATGLGSPSASLAVVGQWALAIAGIPNTALTALWQSTDGATWQRLAVMDGNPLSGTQLVSLGDRVGLLSGSKLTLVGFPSAGGNPTVSPPPTATPTADESPTASPPTTAYVVGGWRWHELNGRLDAGTTVVRVPNGYFGRCGDAMCTSPNGWSWQAPADPAIFATDGPALFSPLSVAHRPGGSYVVNAGEGVWYSLDGVHWKPSTAPADPHGLRAVVYGASGFTLIGSPDDAIGGRSRIYSSPDGATWTAEPIGPMVGVLAQGDTSGGILDQTGKTPTGAAIAYSADGRTWVPASLPTNESVWTIPYRLADGSLVIQGGQAILHSTDGRSWVAFKTGWQPGSLAVAGDRIVAVANGSGSTGVAWESADGGETFHKLMEGVGSVEQFGDLVLLGANGGAYVGAPLSPSEAPGTTPTATGLPGHSAAPAYTPEPTPLGGISRDEAIRIAVAAVHPTAGQAATARASVQMDPRYGRWIWSVSFTRDSGGSMGPASTGDSGTFVDIDFYTGEVLASGYWIS